MGSEINSTNFSEKNLEGTTNKNLSKEEQVELEKQKNNEEIQNYYKKTEMPQETVNINDIDAKKAELENKYKDLQKYDKTEKSEHTKKQLNELNKEQLDMLEKVGKGLEVEKQAIIGELKQLKKLFKSPKQKDEAFLISEINNLYYEIKNCLRDGDIEGVKNKEKLYQDLVTIYNFLKFVEQYPEESKKNETGKKGINDGGLLG